jgi:hypothetical protein
LSGGKECAYIRKGVLSRASHINTTRQALSVSFMCTNAINLLIVCVSRGALGWGVKGAEDWWNDVCSLGCELLVLCYY